MTELINGKRVAPTSEDIQPLKPNTIHFYDEAFMEDVIWQFYETTISNYDLPKYKRFTRQYLFDSKKKSDLIFQLDKAFIIVEIQQDRLNQEHINRAHAYATQLKNEQSSDDVKVLYVSNSIRKQEIKLIENLGHEYFPMEREFFIKRAEDNVEGLKVKLDRPVVAKEENLKPLNEFVSKAYKFVCEARKLGPKQIQEIYYEKFKERIDASVLNRLASGKSVPSVEHIRKLARVLDVHFQVLLTEKSFTKVLGYSKNYIVTDEPDRELKVFVPFNQPRETYNNTFCIVNEGDFLGGKYLILNRPPHTKVEKRFLSSEGDENLCYLESSSSPNYIAKILEVNNDGSLKISKGLMWDSENIIDNYFYDRIYLISKLTTYGDLLTLNQYAKYIEPRQPEGL